MDFLCLNGKILPADQPVLRADNRGYRYGDGVFETMKMISGRIPLADLHMQRLFESLALLGFTQPTGFTPRKLLNNISRLARQNQCSQLARVRLSVSRGNGSLYDTRSDLQWLVECWPAEESSKRINPKGLNLGIFEAAQKSCDRYANLKSANYLIYAEAARYAQSQQLDDCLTYNVKGQIADSTIANLFLIKNRLIITPALGEGCVDGVMRRYLLKKLRELNFDVREGVVTGNDMGSFDEAFLSNAFYGIRWVRRFGKKLYTRIHTSQIYSEVIEPLFA